MKKKFLASKQPNNLITLMALVVFSLCFWAFPPKANASIEFETKQEINYTIGPRGDAEVSQKISLINNFSNIYPQEYHVQIDGNTITNIKAKDKLGDILEEVTTSGTKTEIKLVIKDKQIGKGKITSFDISYSIPKLASKKGLIWEFSIPKLDDIKEIEELTVNVQTPLSFGNLAYSSVSPSLQEDNRNGKTISFNKNNLKNKPLALAFGNFQVFDFSLQFFLENNRGESVKAEIPLPPETAYQSVFYTQIKPLPIKVKLDEDYNWIAEYYLSPNESIKINVQGQAKIFSQPNNRSFLDIYRQTDFSPYLKEDTYWETNQPLILDLAQKYTTPSKAFNYTVETLEYDYQNLENHKRQGALKAIQSKKGVCSEFSDLFVALTRAGGTPSRELEGFAFTNNQQLVNLASENDVLHSWAEYWDASKKIWVPADPTWSKTTGGMDFIDNFDLGHFVFVTHGTSSTKPIPPGYYKNGNNQKNIDVQFATQAKIAPEIELTPELREEKKQLSLIVKNLSLAPIYQTKLDLLGWQNKQGKEEVINLLPPLGEETISISKPPLLKRILGKPKFHLKLGESLYKIEYPRSELNFWDFFVNLIKR